MLQGFLTNLATLVIECDLARELDLKEPIAHFPSTKGGPCSFLSTPLQFLLFFFSLPCSPSLVSLVSSSFPLPISLSSLLFFFSYIFYLSFSSPLLFLISFSLLLPFLFIYCLCHFFPLLFRLASPQKKLKMLIVKTIVIVTFFSSWRVFLSFF
ncbi:unnamed protein product [Acanthosepion pharaonis]|uniref:Uncharacterized protein n=1 Tax=Acanthosepion pharaonis TaxID=158019 RepID=A0A812ED53_ACAPH|nr:unnamed protein product [Sepia pharaonis]